jgi:predicted amidohydrolase YtcJ
MVHIGKAKKQILEAIKKASKNLESDAWLIIFYVDFHLIYDIPTSEDLDIASSGKPVLIVEFGLHSSIASTDTLRRLNITRIKFPEGYVEQKHGQPTGLLHEFAHAQALDIALTEFSQQFTDISVRTLIKAKLD